MSTLENTVATIRMLTPKPKEQTLDDWFKQTYNQALIIWQASHPIPPRVKASKRRSDRLLAEQVKRGIAPGTSDEENEDE